MTRGKIELELSKARENYFLAKAQGDTAAMSAADRVIASCLGKLATRQSYVRLSIPSGDEDDTQTLSVE